VARLNLTIPDDLYERLERWRERVNVSKVCARALEKELAMLEASPSGTIDPKVQRLLQRLLGRRQQWYQRGREDGETWALEVATAGELREVAEEWDMNDEGSFEDVEFPESFKLDEALERWLTADVEEASGALPRRGRNSEAIEKARASVDEWAYASGWQQAIHDLWEQAAPKLRHFHRPDE
jgi:hypothetical protein